MIKTKRLSMSVPIASVGLILAVLAAQLFSIFIPALPVIAFTFLTYILLRYPHVRNLERSDWNIMLLFGGIMLTLLIIRHIAF